MFFHTVPQRTLGSRCDSSEECRDENSVCTESVCTCEAAFYDKTGQCGELSTSCTQIIILSKDNMVW